MLLHAPSPAVVADAKQLPLPDECADVVLCSFTLGYVPSCFPELARIARRGGTVIISDVHPIAIQQGWKRSFKVGTESIDIAHEPYQLTDLRHSSVKMTNLVEPRFGEQERYLFEKAGRGAAFEECTHFPAIFIAAWVKHDG
jgi:malonyl-CoA O-methyltransferase